MCEPDLYHLLRLDSLWEPWYAVIYPAQDYNFTNIISILLVVIASKPSNLTELSLLY